MTDKQASIDNPDTRSVQLKDRKDEILTLAKNYIKAASDEIRTEDKTLSKEAEKYLLEYDWPGDEKELEVTIKRACILSDGPELLLKDFDISQRQIKSIGKFLEDRLSGFMQSIKRFDSFNLYNMVIPEVEKSLIMMVLKETRGNQFKAAKLLGINRNTLRSKIKKLGIITKP
ncbi:MAG: helix-turn-helix domain-containing protein [Thermodesulfovibrionia bacterium]|nr:helix-turn-helix domain-containing protein [Thermodesulfovibrionia bacterium]